MRINLLNKSIFIQTFSLLYVLTLGCTNSVETFSSTSKMDYDSVIQHTINKSLLAINQNKASVLKSYFGYAYPEDLISIEMIQPDVVTYYYLLSKYHNNNLSHMKWETDNTLDELGRIKYETLIFDGFDSLTGFKNVRLNLFFGPPDIVPFDSLSGIEFSIEVDSDYRRQLRLQNKLPKTQDLLRHSDRY